jgi:hypothetical protein
MAIFAMALPAFAGTKTLTFAWEQTLPSPNDLKEWRIYKATTPNVAVAPANLWATVTYVAPQTTYTSPQSLVSPDGQAITYYFVLTAVDAAGNESGKSNEVIQLIDFQGPGSPSKVTVTVTVTTP